MDSITSKEYICFIELHAFEQNNATYPHLQVFGFVTLQMHEHTLHASDLSIPIIATNTLIQIKHFPNMALYQCSQRGFTVKTCTHGKISLVIIMYSNRNNRGWNL